MALATVVSSLTVVKMRCLLSFTKTSAWKKPSGMQSSINWKSRALGSAGRSLCLKRFAACAICSGLWSAGQRSSFSSLNKTISSCLQYFLDVTWQITLEWDLCLNYWSVEVLFMPQVSILSESLIPGYWKGFSQSLPSIDALEEPRPWLHKTAPSINTLKESCP